MNSKIKKGDEVKIKPEWRDEGDDGFVWIALEDEDGGRVCIEPQIDGLACKPNQIVLTGMLEDKAVSAVGSIHFAIHYSGEMGAGLRAFTDTVTISVESKDSGGVPGEFAEFMRNALAEWYADASVTVIAPGEKCKIPPEVEESITTKGNKWTEKTCY
jgi:hypothetical protein